MIKISEDSFSKFYISQGFVNEPWWLHDRIVNEAWFPKYGANYSLDQLNNITENIQLIIEEELSIQHAETGADRELDFDPQAYFEKHYLA